MAKIQGAIVVNVERCKGCELCIEACPSEVIGLSTDVNGKGYRYTYMKQPDLCTGCANCAIVCPDGVISVYRKKNDAEK